MPNRLCVFNNSFDRLRVLYFAHMLDDRVAKLRAF